MIDDLKHYRAQTEHEIVNALLAFAVVGILIAAVLVSIWENL